MGEAVLLEQEFDVLVAADGCAVLVADGLVYHFDLGLRGAAKCRADSQEEDLQASYLA